MCGRTALITPRSLLARRYWGMEISVGDLNPQYNQAPSPGLTTIYRREGQDRPLFDFSVWGFRPTWAGQDAPLAINARAEDVARSRYFQEAFQRHRCLVPATGWYEWVNQNDGKQPYFIAHAGPVGNVENLLWLAGLYTLTGQGISTCCAILTEPAHPDLRHIHDRQQVVIDPECIEAWLDPHQQDRAALKAAIRRLPASEIHAYPVSKAVNKADLNEPYLIQPLQLTANPLRRRTRFAVEVGIDESPHSYSG